MNATDMTLPNVPVAFRDLLNNAQPCEVWYGDHGLGELKRSLVLVGMLSCRRHSAGSRCLYSNGKLLSGSSFLSRRMLSIEKLDELA